MKKTIKEKGPKLLLLIGSVLILLWPALNNGYPLLYFDSASYIVSGHLCKVPIDRPLAYGFLVRHISMSFSLWFVVVLQSIVFVVLTWLSFRIVLKNEKTNINTFITCLLIGLFTGASNYSSQIMPDIFSAFMIWALALLFVANRSFYRWLLFFIAVFSALVHLSNMLTISVLSALSLLLVLIFRKRITHYKCLILQFSLLPILPWLLLLTINYAVEKDVFVNKSSNIFFTGRLIETGILKKYFSEYPESSQYSLYQKRDHLPEKSWQFVWNEDSPLYEGDCIKSGWETCWLVKSEEYGKMIQSTLSKTNLLVDFVSICLKDWKVQLLDIEIGPLTVFDGNSNLNNVISQYFDDAFMFKKSNQFHENMAFSTESTIQKYFLIVSIVVLLISGLLLLKLKTNKNMFIMLLVVFFGIMINALVCSAFSNVLNRYQSRVVWLIALTSIIFAIVVLEELMCSKKSKPKP